MGFSPLTFFLRSSGKAWDELDLLYGFIGFATPELIA